MQTISSNLVLRSFLLAAVLGAAARAQTTRPFDPARWEQEIAAMEKRDRDNPPPKDGIVFVGSSSIRLWNLEKSFPALPALNRGFGGSFIADSTHFADRIVLPHRPRLIVFYAGENDIAAGLPPKQVADDFKRLVATVHETLPKTRIVFISLKPSPLRWKHIEDFRQTNRLIRQFISTDPRLAFVDVEEPMLGDDGRPRQELFVDDQLHLSDEGYRLWTALMAPHLRDFIQPAP